jgi:hypothetical protein
MYKSGVVDAENGGSSFSDIRTSTGSFVPKGGYSPGHKLALFSLVSNK